jgi:hypothetical protein
MDTRTPQERAYDATRLSRAPIVDEPLSADEEQALNLLLARQPSAETMTLADGRKIPVRHSRDAAEREERMLTILERIAGLPEPEQSEAIGYACGLIDGLLISRKQ